MESKDEKKQQRKKINIIQQVKPNSNIHSQKLQGQGSVHLAMKDKKQKTQVPKQYIHFIELQKQMIQTLERICQQISKRIGQIDQKYKQQIFKSIKKQMQIQHVINKIINIELQNQHTRQQRPVLKIRYNFQPNTQYDIRQSIQKFTEHNAIIRSTIQDFFQHLLNEKRNLEKTIDSLRKKDESSPDFPKCLKQVLLQGIQNIQQTTKYLQDDLKKHKLFKIILQGKFKVSFERKR